MRRLFSSRLAAVRKSTTKLYVDTSHCVVSYSHLLYLPLHSHQKLEALLEALYSTSDASGGLITSGTLSQSADQFGTLWSFRELIPEAVSKAGKVYKYDVSVPVRKFKEIPDIVRSRLAEKGLLRGKGETTGEGEAKVVDVYGYGHFGDGEFSLGVLSPPPLPMSWATLDLIQSLTVMAMCLSHISTCRKSSFEHPC